MVFHLYPFYSWLTVPLDPGSDFAALCVHKYFLLIGHKVRNLDMIIRNICVAYDFPFELAELHLLQIPSMYMHIFSTI